MCGDVPTKRPTYFKLTSKSNHLNLRRILQNMYILSRKQTNINGKTFDNGSIRNTKGWFQMESSYFDYTHGFFLLENYQHVAKDEVN